MSMLRSRYLVVSEVMMSPHDMAWRPTMATNTGINANVNVNPNQGPNCSMRPNVNGNLPDTTK